MANFYSNITLIGPDPRDVIASLKAAGVVAYVSAKIKGAVVIFHEDLSGQEDLASRLSDNFGCPAWLVMVFGESILLYHLYQNGQQIDAYVSSPHEQLELTEPAPPGDAEVLCAAFEAERFEMRVSAILRKPAKPEQPYAYAINRHGELLRALGMPLFAAGAGFAAIELGELPEGSGFDFRELVKT